MNNELDFGPDAEFSHFGDDAEAEQKRRIENGLKNLPFGVSFLDEALGGIIPEDLVVVASKTGKGKTQLVANIAFANTSQKKHIHFFALEASTNEIERRLTYEIVAREFYKRSNKPPITLNYTDWNRERFKEHLKVEEEFAAKELLEHKKYFHTYYRPPGVKFTAAEFKRIFEKIKGHTDLIIIDHLHYFEVDNESEMRGLKEIIMSLRDTALLSRRPIILVSHVRKSDRRFKQVIPDMEDLHGSSEIAKNATKVITMGRLNDNLENRLSETVFQIGKNREDGARTGATAVIAYNFDLNVYQPDYSLVKMKFDGSGVDHLPQEKIPFWAKSAVVIPPEEEQEDEKK